MFSYDTSSEAINDLIKRGYDTDLNIDGESGLIKGEHPISKKVINLLPDDFEIDEVYRFEGDSDPGDEMVVYAISSGKHNIKGVLVSAFGSYSGTGASEVIKKLSMHMHAQYAK